jgi:hypothetical protein
MDETHHQDFLRTHSTNCAANVDEHGGC